MRGRFNWSGITAAGIRLVAGETGKRGNSLLSALQRFQRQLKFLMYPIVGRSNAIKLNYFNILLR
jgi:hypothetical protein